MYCILPIRGLLWIVACAAFSRCASEINTYFELKPHLEVILNKANYFVAHVLS